MRVASPALLPFGLLLAGLLAAQTAPITLDVDASATTRKLLSAHEDIPVSPGPLTLVYPKWIPGDHAPQGPVTDLVGLHFSASGHVHPVAAR